jgi:hypothetical protein
MFEVRIGDRKTSGGLNTQYSRSMWDSSAARGDHSYRTAMPLGKQDRAAF